MTDCSSVDVSALCPGTNIYMVESGDASLPGKPKMRYHFGTRLKPRRKIRWKIVQAQNTLTVTKTAYRVIVSSATKSEKRHPTTTEYTIRMYPSSFLTVIFLKFEHVLRIVWHWILQ